MQKCLDNNIILMYSTQNKRKSVISGRFIKILKGKTCKKVTANGSKFYLSYVNKLVDQNSNTYHHSIIKKAY